MSQLNGAFPKHIHSPEYYMNKQFMFIDISGFTPLCDKFISESSYGAEKIGDLVNTVFNPIIDFVFEKGGDVISFAGDALFVAVEKKSVKAVQDMSQKLIKEQTIDKSLAITIDMLKDEYYPNIIKSAEGSSFSYYPQKDKNDLLKNTFPDEIYEIYQSNFRGELRAVPVFFIHISEKYSINKIRPLLEFITEKSKENSVYINKIEYLDKGWMILLSAGSPVYSSEAPVKIYELLSKFSKKAKTYNIPVQIGGTLQRGYCGIIGNEKRWEFTFLGSNVNLAARIAFSSENYKISCDESFAYSSQNLLKSESIGIKTYKGVGEREIFEITGKINDTKNIFVGREKEVLSCLNFFSGDRRAFVLLNGPSGIGKTVLAEHIIQSLGYKFLIRLKGVFGNESAFSLFDNFCDKNSGAAEIFKKFKAIKQPTLIYIDDLHFADDSSLFMFHRMINEGNPFVNFIATTIGREKVKITPLSYYESLIIDLQPFDPKDIQHITKMISGINITLKTSKMLHRSTQGNPLFITKILPYITKDIENSGKVPYSLQEIILMKLNEIPDKGPEFIDGGSVYGDIFDHGVVREVINLKDKIFRDIVSKAENEGLVRRSLSRDEMEFSNTIIREIIYERLLKKKIDFFRIKIAEAIVDSKTKDLKKLYKAVTMYFSANDNRALPLALKLVEEFKRTKDHGTLRSIVQRSFEFIKKNNLYSKAYDFIELFSRSSQFVIGAKLTTILEEIAFKITDWRNNEKLLLYIARLVFEIQFKAPEELLKKYLELKGEDKHYLWTKVKTCAYVIPQNEAVKIFYDLKNKFEGNERVEFYIDFVGYAFFITGNVDMEKEGIKELQRLESSMPVYLKVSYLFIKNSIAIHRDDMTESKKCLDEITSYNKKDVDLSDSFSIYNDYSILYLNLAYENFDKEYIKRSLKYSIKAVKAMTDLQIEADLPLMTTNLASYYMTSGYVKKAERTYLEGLYYGLNIDHPVEVLYTKSRIAFQTSASGAYALSIKLSDEVIQGKITDILSGSYTIKYLYGGKKENDLKTAKKYALEIAKFGSAKCYWEMSRLMTQQAFADNDISEMKKIRRDLMKWRKYTQRAGNLFANETTIKILGLMSGIKTEAVKVRDRLSKLEKLNVNFSLQGKCCYALGLHHKDIDLLKKAKKYALKMREYPFVLRIEKELYRITQDNYWSRRMKISEKKLKEVNKIKSIEEFFGY
ncbi:MAG: AAA family ATPase [Candidatus Delongbacteria bacterium]|nr:AAA family ATPase [Candidatus Delongbacteria bacterium]